MPRASGWCNVPRSAVPRPSVPKLTLRPVAEADLSFLRALYAETRAREVATTGWPETLQTTFLNSQFDGQQLSYRQEFPDATHDIVLAAGKPVGRLYVARSREAVTVVDITLLAAHRGQGWGGFLLQRVLAEAERAGLPARLHVFPGNRVRRLYQRLGFREIGLDRGYLLMERPAGKPG